MDVLDILLRWLHILPALTLVGATAFMKFALHPSLSELADDERKKLQDAVRRRWAVVVMISIALLLMSGIINYALMIVRYEFPGKLYHPLLGVKILLALPVFFIASKLVGRSESAAKFRENASKWLTINLILAVLIVCLAGVAKFAEHRPKPDKSARQTAPTDPTQAG